MTDSLLKVHPDTDLLVRYKTALRRLEADPDDRTAQHQAVLCLARLGATDFELSEYDRYGLDTAVDDEDCIALQARLYKDLFLRAEGDAANTYGRKSAQLYDRAFRVTGGYYSAINAATMGFLTGDPQDDIRGRAFAVLAQLAERIDLSPSEHYYVEATRAEAYLLLNDVDRAEHALRGALRFDPLNYTAHATTLKQLRLIMAAQQLNDAWLGGVQPPRPICFAGHIWSDDLGPDEDVLHQTLSDIIQSQDIGFAYGALAAGADIVMAESFLADGVALHLIFPTPIEAFVARSVTPFGATWRPRFEACLAQAASVKVLAGRASGLQSTQLAADVSMGQTILRSRDFARRPAQLLLLNPDRIGSLTHRLKHVWKSTGFETFEAAVALAKADPKASALDTMDLNVAFLTTDGFQTQTLPNPAEVLDVIRSFRDENPEQTIIVGFNQDKAKERLGACLIHAVPGTMLITDDLAAIVTLSRPNEAIVTYAGLVNLDGDDTHLYSLS
jgi:tetratricopeptide (TPR) repeat protein